MAIMNSFTANGTTYDIFASSKKTVEDLKADASLKEGSYVRTEGYYAENDGGGAIYRIEGVTIETSVDIGTQAITLSNRTGCIVTGCHIITPQRYSIREMGTSNKNIIACNRSPMPLEILGAATLNVNNIIG